MYKINNHVDCVNLISSFKQSVEFVETIKKDLEIKFSTDGKYTINQQMFELFCDFIMQKTDWCDSLEIEDRIYYSSLVATVFVGEIISSQNHLYKFSVN